jgi:multidrug efflux system membrane fusion protein
MRIKLKSKKPLALSIAAIVLMVAAGVFSITSNSKADASAPEGMAPQAMPVDVDLITFTKARAWREFSGRMAAVDLAEIRPQVSGTITEIRFTDGQRVKQGDVLYVIDPRPFNAAVQQAEAEVTAARNANTLAQSVLKRAEGLIKTAAISQRIYDERANETLVTEAEVLGAVARLELARINLDYAYIKAPISGRTSRAEITLGNLVSAGPTAPLLTTIVSDSGIYAEFEVDEKTYMDHIHVVAGIRNNELKIPVEIFIGSNRQRYDGFVHSLDNRIDPSSGTIRARAFFENENTTLVPGMFVRVNVGSAEIQDNILLSERAVGTNQSRKFVYVVNAENNVEYREVRLGESRDGNRIILTGLEEGEMVITAGLMRIRPGMPVVPKIHTVAEESTGDHQIAAAQ